MSWLSKALKNNTFKIGATILAGGFAREYLYGDYGMSGTGIGAKYQYSGGNFFGDALQKVGVTPFAETGIGKSFIGTALEYMRPGGDNDLVSSQFRYFQSCFLWMPQASFQLRYFLS